MATEEISKSTYLDFTGYRIVPDGTSVEAAYGMKPADIVTATDAHMNVAIVLGRANAASDPNLSILSQPWAARQAAIADQTKLWKAYGADQANYDTVYNALRNDGFKILDSSNSYYVTSPESRTIWVQLDKASDFNTLFSSTLMKFQAPNASPYDPFVFWNGDLSLPKEWKVAGLWFDTDNVPQGSALAYVTPTTLSQGPQSVGNSTALSYPIGSTGYSTSPPLAPQKIGDLYNFPLKGANVSTGLIGLIEPGTGSYLPGDALGTNFQARLTSYLANPAISQSGSGQVSVQGIYGQASSTGERSLDVGIVAAVNPNSNLVLYNGSGANPPVSPGNSIGTNGLPTTGFAASSIFTAVQSAIWDTTRNPEVTTNSWGDDQSMAPGSPFYNAYWQLFADAALRNQSTFIALGDGGSGNETSNGVTNVEYNVTQPYNVLVGGTSLSTFGAAQADPTLNPLVSSALAGNLQTIWQLVSGGLRSLPTDTAATQFFVEAVWNSYYVDGKTITSPPGSFYQSGYNTNSTGSGGVDPTQPVPSYQVDYGLNPVTADPLHQVGRGVPDVAINAGGNLMYLTPTADMGGSTAATLPDDGTSAASPLWASLAIQLNAIFADQNLPRLGYINDLLYTAAAVAPASFSDVSLGNNTSSFVLGGSYSSDGKITPTGLGYTAGPGYDLTTGLGSPDGLLLARALTAIAQAQTWSKSPAVFGTANAFSGVSTVSQTLLVQDELGAGTSNLLGVGTGAPVAATGGSPFAWTSRLAEQTLQKDFDPALVTLFDGAAQGTTYSVAFNAGQGVAAYAGSTPLPLYQASYTNPFGIVEFGNASGDVTLARPVAVAQTAGGASNQDAIVRLRQVTTDTLKLEAYKVDDFNGTINGIAPGQAGYATAATTRDYVTDNGTTVITGPGYGKYGEARLKGVNPGDIVALHLTNAGTGDSFWAFAAANEKVDGSNVNHLWSYGLNTFGWESTKGGGDRDYNDLIVGIDFTSASGHALIA